MKFKTINKVELDFSASGRGLQKVLLLLAYLYLNPGSTLLLDEPDAHLEILRQRQIYHLISDIAERNNSQIIAASHSEVVLNEAAHKDMVIAFVGRPHRIDRGSYLLKSLKDIEFEDYYNAEQTGWIFYVEGFTDLEILRIFAKKLDHPARQFLERPFVHYAQQPSVAKKHFYGLQEAYPPLIGIAIFDKTGKTFPRDEKLVLLQWRKREVENYFCQKEVLFSYEEAEGRNDLFKMAETNRRVSIMTKLIDEFEKACELIEKPSPWSDDIKATDDFLDPLFENYFRKLNLPNILRKSGYYELVDLVQVDKIDPEITEKQDAICEVAKKAKSLQE